MATVVTTWDIAPDYDKWGIDTFWSCDNWVQWHQQLKKRFGSEKANALWNYAYAQQGMFSSPLDCRTYNTAFRDYVKKEKLDPYANVGAMKLILQPIGAGSDLVGSASDTISGIGKGVAEFFQGGMVKTLLFVALFGTVGYFGYKFYKEVKQ